MKSSMLVIVLSLAHAINQELDKCKWIEILKASLKIYLVKILKIFSFICFEKTVEN